MFFPRHQILHLYYLKLLEEEIQILSHFSWIMELMPMYQSIQVTCLSTELLIEDTYCELENVDSIYVGGEGKLI